MCRFGVLDYADFFCLIFNSKEMELISSLIDVICINVYNNIPILKLTRYLIFFGFI